MGFVYRLDFASGKSYVGATKNVRNRLVQHRSRAKRGEPDAVYAAWREFGEPTLVVLEEVDGYAELCAAERRHIAERGTLVPGGYNMVTGYGDTSIMVEVWANEWRGQKHTDEARALMSERNRGRTSPNKGKTLSPEWRAKMAVAHTGLKASDETKKRMAAARSAYWAAKRAEKLANGSPS